MTQGTKRLTEELHRLEGLKLREILDEMAKTGSPTVVLSFNGTQDKPVAAVALITGPDTADRIEALEKPNIAQAYRDVLAERQRQVEAEGHDPVHDDSYVDGQLSLAAAAYTLSASPADALGDSEELMDLLDVLWPWEEDWKPTTSRRDLVKAGALILAEIERLDRACLRDATEMTDNAL